MSTDKAPPTSVFARLRPPAALNYLAMTGAGLLVYGMIMMAKGNDIGAIIALLLAIPGILARWTASPVLVLLLTVYLSIDRGFGGIISTVSGGAWVPNTVSGGFELNDVLLPASLLAYVIGHFRLTSIIYQSMPDDLTVRRERDLANPPRRPVELVSPQELFVTLIVAGCCVVAGIIAWFVIDIGERLGRPNDSDMSVSGARLVLLIWLLGLGLMIVSAALIYMRANRMTQTEAIVSLRDEFFQENRRETDRLLRWRRWFKERTALRRRAGK